MGYSSQLKSSRDLSPAVLANLDALTHDEDGFNDKDFIVNETKEREEETRYEIIHHVTVITHCIPGGPSNCEEKTFEYSYSVPKKS